MIKYFLYKITKIHQNKIDKLILMTILVKMNKILNKYKTYRFLYKMRKMKIFLIAYQIKYKKNNLNNKNKNLK